ncbi:GNAT family N-acetyltransferase [Actinoalloteichus hymeniacidonis]|uniref:Acetyltransferase (GNAT) family protein n=1 Tax=Actinoalloteichus hymeniacidonis TaxID=340345 RepID=A0AAC9HTA8_9PSEU|nr:GNAT family N-acetyltransferase [Actinoalloteichus hymeniacidonis]AOS65292.1 acetyltransferase (GNAT) family protein [Actinoalloteichus hymeniacidonis]MBB5906624.1 GNAT superfamily N-acetyltransferase [Actinoalloteichus hymeniacidonis]
MDLRITPFDHPDSERLIAEVQQEYVQRYGDEDATPVAPEQFAPPHGLFVIGYLDGRPVATGGWRRVVVGEDGMDDGHLRTGDVELKRMYVAEGFRGRGLARRTLAFLEQAAADAGYRRIILETGDAQPEAVALYGSSGYHPLPKYGHYRDDVRSLCFGKVLDAVATPGPAAGETAIAEAVRN